MYISSFDSEEKTPWVGRTVINSLIPTDTKNEQPTLRKFDMFTWKPECEHSGSLSQPSVQHILLYTTFTVRKDPTTANTGPNMHTSARQSQSLS